MRTTVVKCMKKLCRIGKYKDPISYIPKSMKILHKHLLQNIVYLRRITALKIEI